MRYFEYTAEYKLNGEPMTLIARVPLAATEEHIQNVKKYIEIDAHYIASDVAGELEYVNGTVTINEVDNLRR